MNKYMLEADKEAKRNLITNDGGPFGAVIVKDGIIVGRGSNQVLKEKDPTLHAEMVAIKDACKNLNSYDLSGCTIYTSCYPCPMCMSAIIWANIKEVYYGNCKEDADFIGFRDDFIYNYFRNILNDKEDDTLKLINIDRDETIKTFEDFKNKTDKTIY